MAFDREPVRTPDSIGTIVVVLKDSFLTDEDGTVALPYQRASFQVNVVMDDGSMVVRKGDLAPHITPAQKQALMAFMSSLRVQANEQILGVEPNAVEKS